MWFVRFAPMRLSRLLILAALFVTRPELCLAQAVIEGRVELPKDHSAPVMNKRYEIVAKGGVLAPMPPLAVIYLEGAFPKRIATPTKQMIQKDLTFGPALLPVQVGTRVEFPNLDDTYHNIFHFRRPSASISGATARMKFQYLQSFSMFPALLPCVVTFTSTCARSFLSSTHLTSS